MTVIVLLCCASLAQASSVQAVLRGTGKAVERFWEQFSAINCAEQITQVKLNQKGKPVSRQESSFDYLALMRIADGELSVDESRVSQRSSGNAKDTPLLVTSGFSTLLLVFHPHFQNSFEYSEPSEESLDGKKTWRVDFRHVRGGRTPSCLRLRGRDYPIEWSGTAWIEPESGSILRITAGLQSSMEDLGLRALDAEVRYGPVRFTDAPEEYWLPAIATIEARTPLQHWKNVHRFSNYKRFSVSTSERTESPR
jgi:hypothetical protein